MKASDAQATDVQPAPALDGIEAPSAEIAEAQRRAFVADVQDRPGLHEAVADLAKIDERGTVRDLTRAELPATEFEVAQAPLRGATVRKGLRPPVANTARALGAVLRPPITSEDATSSARGEVTAPEPRRGRAVWIVGGLVAFAALLWLAIAVSSGGSRPDQATATPVRTATVPVTSTAAAPAPTAPIQEPLATSAPTAEPKASSAASPHASAAPIAKTAAPTASATPSTTGAPVTATAGPTATSKPTATSDIPFIDPHGP